MAIFSWVILMGIVGIALVTFLTVMVIAALVARARHDGSGPGLAAIFGVVAVLLGIGLLFPFGIFFLRHAASVPAEAISVGTHAVHTASQLAYEGITIPARVVRHGPQKLSMLLVVGGFLLLVWMLSKDKTRAIGSWILSIGAVVILLGGGVLLLLGVSHRETRISHIGPPPPAFEMYRPFVAERMPRAPTWRRPGTGLQQPDIHQAHQAVAKTRVQIDRVRRKIQRLHGGINPLEMAAAIETGPEPKRVEDLPAEAMPPSDRPMAAATELADAELADAELADAELADAELADAELADAELADASAAESSEPTAATADGESNEGESDDADDSDEPAEPLSDPPDAESAGDASEGSPADSAADLTDAPTEPETAEPNLAVAKEPKGETSEAAGDAAKEGADHPKPPEASDDASTPEPDKAIKNEDKPADHSADSVSAATIVVKDEQTAVIAEQAEEPVVDAVVVESPAKTTAPPPAGSGEPGDATASQPLPDWVKVPPKLVGTSYRRTAVSDPFSTDDECRRQLRGRMMVITYEYLSELLGFRHVRRVEERFAEVRLRNLGISPAYIRQNICKDEYIEHIGSSVDKMIGAGFGQMRRIHVLMEFDDAVQNKLKRQWKDSRLVERLAVVGGGALGIVALVGLLFAYLKFDTATKGYYTRRLQVAIGLVTILVVAALVAMLG